MEQVKTHLINNNNNKSSLKELVAFLSNRKDKLSKTRQTNNRNYFKFSIMKLKKVLQNHSNI